MRRLFCRGEAGAGKEAVPTVGHDPGRLESRGWRRGLTLRSHIHPRRAPQSHQPPRPRPHWRDVSGSGKGPGSGAQDTRGRSGNTRAHEPHKSRPRPHSRHQTMALPEKGLQWRCAVKYRSFPCTPITCTDRMVCEVCALAMARDTALARQSASALTAGVQNSIIPARRAGPEPCIRASRPARKTGPVPVAVISRHHPPAQSRVRDCAGILLYRPAR